MAFKASQNITDDILSGHFSKDGIVLKYNVSENDFIDLCKGLLRNGLLAKDRFEQLTGTKAPDAFPQGVEENIISDTKQCPYCAENIKKAAVVCRFCGYDLQTGRRATARNTVPKVQAKTRSTVADGVRIGFGMFIMLPILLVGAVLLLAMCSASLK